MRRMAAERQRCSLIRSPTAGHGEWHAIILDFT
jgi:hypothetical protein